MKKDLFNKRILNKDNMYKTLEDPQALKDYLQIQHDVARFKAKHTKAMQRSYKITFFIINEMLEHLANALDFQKLRSKKR